MCHGVTIYEELSYDSTDYCGRIIGTWYEYIHTIKRSASFRVLKKTAMMKDI